MSSQLVEKKTLAFLDEVLVKFKYKESIDFEGSKNVNYFINDVLKDKESESQYEILEYIIRWAFSIDDIDNLSLYSNVMNSIIDEVRHDINLYLRCNLKYAEGLFFTVNDYEKVKSLCESGCKIIEDNNMKLDILFTDYLLLLARAFEESSEYEIAEGLFQQAEDIREKSDEMTDYLKFELYYYYGHYCLGVNYLEKAEELFNKAENVISEKEEFGLRVSIIDALVSIDIKNEDYLSAIKKIDELLQKSYSLKCTDNQYIELLKIKANVYFKFSFEKAKNTYVEVLRIQRAEENVSFEEVFETEIQIINIDLLSGKYLLAKEKILELMKLNEQLLKSMPMIKFKMMNIYLDVALSIEDFDEASKVIKDIDAIISEEENIEVSEYNQYQFNCAFYYGSVGQINNELEILYTMKTRLRGSERIDYDALFRCNGKIANTQLNQEEYEKAYNLYIELIDNDKYANTNKVNYAVMLAEFVRTSVKLNRLHGLDEIINIIEYTFRDMETLEYAKAISAYSTYYEEINNTFEHERCIRDVIRIKEKIAPMNYASLSKAKNSLAIYYMKYGLYKEAVEIFSEVKEIFYSVYGKNSYEHCRLLANIAIGYFEMRNDNKAEQYTLICNKIINDLDGSYIHLKSQIMMLNVRLSTILGDYSKARQIAENLYNDLDINKWNLGFQYSVITKIIEIDILEGYSEDAVDKLTSFKGILTNSDDNYLLALVNHDLANVYYKIGRYDEAVIASIEAVDATLNFKFDSYLSSSGKVAVSMDYKLAPMYNLLLTGFSKLNELEKQKYVGIIIIQLFARKIDEIFLNKLKDKLVVKELVNRSSHEVEYKKILLELDYVNDRQPENLDEYRSMKLEIARLRSKKEMIENKLLQDNFNYKEVFIELKTIDVFTNIVVEYHEYIDWESDYKKPRYVAVTYNLLDIDDSNISYIAEYDLVSELIYDIRNLIKKNEVVQEKASVVKLKNLLFKPISKAIGDVREVIFAPDGILSFIPFELFFEDIEISYLPNCSSLVWYKKSQDLDTTVSILGDPLVFIPRNNNESLTSKRFELPTGNLKYSELECSTIANILNINSENVSLYTRNSFDKKSLLKQPSDTIIHISSHGYYFKRKQSDNQNSVDEMIVEADDTYERCGITTSYTSLVYNDESLYKDVIISGRDIIESDFSNTKLVTLSACDTGMGDIVWNKSSIGLHRAFLYAGAENVIVSLWQVNDFSTALLMIRFYELIAEGFRVADALNKSKTYIKGLTREEIVLQGYEEMDFINKSKPFESEYYWAGFICIGSGKSTIF